MTKTVYLSPTTIKGIKTLLDTADNQYAWPNDDRYARLCDVALKNGNAVKVTCVDDILRYGTAKIESIQTGTSIVKDFPELTATQLNVIPSDLPKEQLELMSFISSSTSLRPKTLKMTDLKWKYLVRSAMRAKNILMTGPAGCGKTMAAKSLVSALDRPDFYFNLGATQDPRSTLIGNTHFNKEDGTIFAQAHFVTAIQTENAVILLDELSRAHPDAHNILMTVLDEGQRYLRLDEAEGSPTIKVAKGVTFIATANIGNEYTATRVMDRALLDRFIIVEMDVLNEDEEFELLKMIYPKVTTDNLRSIANIVGGTRLELMAECPRISTHISTRASIEMASLMYDGFTIEESAEVCIYPQFDGAGGIDSERTFVKQLVQKHVILEGHESFDQDNSADALFSAADIRNA